MSTTHPRIQDTDWKLWLAENLIRGIAPETLRDILVSQGMKPGTVQHELNTLVRHPAMRAALPYGHAMRRLRSIEARERRLEAYTRPFEIERVAGLTPERFYREYYATNTPVILTDATAQWPALKLWSPAYLRTHAGQERISVMTGRDADPLYMQNQDRHMIDMTLASYVDMVERASVTNDFYMVARNRNLEKAGFAKLREDLQPLPSIMDPDSRPDTYVMWFGPAGTRTPLHHDPNAILFCQISGRKRYWMIKPDEPSLILTENGHYSPIDAERPDLGRYPEFAEARVHTFDVGPGDVLFIPIGWWHQVYALDVGLSVTLDEFRKPHQI